MASRTETTLVQKIREELNQCAGIDGDKISKDRIKAWDYYFQRKRGDEIPGRSSVVSSDVSSMVEAVLSQVDEAFSTDNIAEFQAHSAEDEDQARLESDTVTEYVMSRNNGSLEILSAVKSTLLLRNAVVKVWVEEKRTTYHQELHGVELEAFAEITREQPGLEVAVKEYNPTTGYLSLSVTETKRRLRVADLPMVNFYYPRDWDKLDLQSCPFMAERHIEPRADLIDRGFPSTKVNKMKKYSHDMRYGSTAQSPDQQTQFLIGIDESQESVEWFEVYALTKDGRKRIAVSLLDNMILENVSVEHVPYAAGAAFINPNRFTGISLFDKLKQTQDITTGLERAALDNVNTVNKNRTAYIDGVVNVDDMDNGRTNGNIRVRAGSVTDVRQAVTPFTVPDISQGILANIQNQKQTRSEVGGAALTLATGELQLGDRAGSQGIDRAYSVMEQLSSHMIRNIAKTLIRSVFLLAHETMRRNFDAALQIKKDGRWQTTNASEWQPRENVLIKVGMSPGERTRRVTMFEKMLSNQIALAGQGMDEVLVNVEGFYATMMDWARAGDIKNPERYFVDPRSEPAQKSMQSKQAQAKTSEDMKQQLITQAIELEKMRTAMTKYQTDVDAQFKYYDANLKAETEEAKIAGGATIELLKNRTAKQGGPQSAAAPKIEEQKDE